MTLIYQRAGVWSMVAFGALLGFALVVLGQLIPPPQPSYTATEIAPFYAAHHTGLRLAAITVCFGAVLAIPWAVVISMQITRIEGRWGFLAVSQLVAGAFLSIGLM